MDQLGIEQNERRFAFRQRFAVGGIFVLVLLDVYFSVKVVAIAQQISSLPIRIPLLALWCELALLPIYMFGVTLHRRWTTGRFLLTPAEYVQKRQDKLDCYGKGKPFWPQSGYLIAQGGFGLFFLTLAAALWFGILHSDMFEMFGNGAQSLVIVTYVLFAVFLAVPCILLFKAARRKQKTGSFLVSREEMAKAFTQCSRPTPPLQSILVAELNGLVALIYTASPIIRYLRHRPFEISSVLLALLWWGITAVWIWRAKHPAACSLGSLSLLEKQDDTAVQSEEDAKTPMKRSTLIALIAVPLVLASGLGYFIVSTVHPDPVIYPAPAQARADLASALQAAALTHKRILLDFGVNWCGDCQTLDRYMRDATNLPLVESNYIHVLINTDSTNDHDPSSANQDLANRYAIPLDKGVPALAVLNDKGELIYSQQNGEFGDMRHMKSLDLTAFLLRWKP